MTQIECNQEMRKSDRSFTRFQKFVDLTKAPKLTSSPIIQLASIPSCLNKTEDDNVASHNDLQKEIIRISKEAKEKKISSIRARELIQECLKRMRLVNLKKEHEKRKEDYERLKRDEEENSDDEDEKVQGVSKEAVIVEEKPVKYIEIGSEDDKSDSDDDIDNEQSSIIEETIRPSVMSGIGNCSNIAEEIEEFGSDSIASPVDSSASESSHKNSNVFGRKILSDSDISDYDESDCEYRSVNKVKLKRRKKEKHLKSKIIESDEEIECTDRSEVIPKELKADVSSSCKAYAEFRRVMNATGEQFYKHLAELRSQNVGACSFDEESQLSSLGIPECLQNSSQEACTLEQLFAESCAQESQIITNDSVDDEEMKEFMRNAMMELREFQNNVQLPSQFSQQPSQIDCQSQLNNEIHMPSVSSRNDDDGNRDNDIQIENCNYLEKFKTSGLTENAAEKGGNVWDDILNGMRAQDIVDDDDVIVLDGDNSRESDVDDEEEDGEKSSEKIASSDDELEVFKQIKSGKYSSNIRSEFIEEEACQSGDDVSSGDEDVDEEDEYEVEEGDYEDVPDEDILKQQLRLHVAKQLQDEDDRDIMHLKEQFMVDDLQNVNSDRKIRLQIRDMAEEPDYQCTWDDNDDNDDDDDDDQGELYDIEDEKVRRKRSKMQEWKTKNSDVLDIDGEDDSMLINAAKEALDFSNFGKTADKPIIPSHNPNSFKSRLQPSFLLIDDEAEISKSCKAELENKKFPNYKRRLQMNDSVSKKKQQRLA